MTEKLQESNQSKYIQAEGSLLSCEMGEGGGARLSGPMMLDTRKSLLSVKGGTGWKGAMSPYIGDCLQLYWGLCP